MKHETAAQSFGLADGVNIAVIAGAGTGKTTRLIGEIIALIERRGVPVERILAVTFSDSAAADMKEKLRNKLEASLTRAGDGRFLTAISSLPRAQISTLHSLALRILRENPFEAGIDPEFIIQEESSDILLADEIWRQWAKRMFWGGTRHDDDLVMLLRYMSAESLKGIALTLASRPDRLEDYLKWRMDPERERLRFEKRLQDLSTALSGMEPSADNEELLYKRFLAAKEILAERDLTAIAEAVKRSRLKKTPGSPKKWRDSTEFEKVKQLIDGPGGAIDTLREVGDFLRGFEEDAVTRTAIHVLSDFVEFFQAQERRRGILSFFDLIWETKKLLERDLSVRRRYQDEFDYILVDEFQDIDPILGDIVLLLAENRPTAGRPYDVQLKPGKLFIVGDPKQSIYRFREADVGVFFSVLRKIEESGGRVDRLEINYRSQRHLIAFQNDFFDRYIRHEDDRYTIEYDRLTPALSDIAAADRPPATRIVDSDPGRSLSAEEIRQAEADYIADQINDLVEKKLEGRVVRDSRNPVAGGSEYRDIEYRDIAILFRSLSGVSALYEEALKRTGIPYFIMGGRGYFQRQEVFDVTNVLRAVFDPADRRSLVGVLRSPVFGIDDVTLYQAASGEKLSYLTDKKEGPVGEALEVLRRLHDSAFRLTLSDLLSEIYRTIPIMEVNAFGPGGAQRVGNLMKIRETARALESEGPVTLSAFVKLLTTLALEREDEGEATVMEEGRNAVRIMTIHAAKGLEFPIVFVPDLGRKRRQWDRDGIFIDRSDEPVSGARVGPMADFGYRYAIRTRENLRLAAEERRLLYVAATRARDRLILIGSPKGETSHQRALMEFVESYNSSGPPPAVMEQIDGKETGKFLFGKKRARLGDLLSGSVDTTLLDLAAGAEQERWAQCERAMKQKLFSFVTEGKDEEWVTGRPAVVADPEGIGRLVGTLVHEVLWQVDFSLDERSDGLVERAVLSMGLPPDITARVVADARPLVDGFLSSDAGREIASSRIVGREVPILMSRDGVTLTGRIDIVYETQEGMVVLDYKTDAVTREGAPRAAEKYRDQIAAYVDALTDATKTDKNMRGGVYFMRADAVVYFE